MEYSLFTLLILSMAIMNLGYEVDVVHEWEYVEFEWESQEQKENAINSGTYNPNTSILVDATKTDDGRLFITATNVFGPGSPATLTTITNKTGSGGPILRPYPNWSWHNGSCICDGIVNVFRIDIQCNHIIVLDYGKMGLSQICNPKLLIFDLKDDTLVKTIHLPLDFATNQTGSGLLITPLVYIRNISGKCTQFLNKMFVFITDSGGSGLIMYDSSRKRMCRIESDYMKPTDTSFSTAGENYTFEGGIASLTILDDELYYVPISRKEIYKIKIETLLECPNKEEANKQSKLVTKLSSQTAVITSTKNSIFYSNLEAMSILGMNVNKISNENAVELAQDDEKFQSIVSMKPSYY
ncbi:PREDICTED: major royal jelly protein 3-like [Trachymyrmex cornetzi]|uniref:major royal jelly protein 3-like n=1 Tax=Trachymyrmex cornetzi TaxID=471704 RepID=UPI00084F1DC7|nr:PREDICTED: major royal jelly protein 3-like [Trachymyrmex cornetzi]